MIQLVTGPPCSGKSTHVREHADPRDVVLDLDLLANALGYPAEHVDWGEVEPHPARVLAMIARASVIKAIQAGQAQSAPHVWVVASFDKGAMALQRRATGPVEVLVLDPGAALCHARAVNDGRPEATHDQIDRWYAERDAAGHAATGVTSERW